MPSHYQERNRMARVHTAWEERGFRHVKVDPLLQAHGYPCTYGTWSRLLTNGRLNQHLITTLAEIFEVPVSALIPPWRFDALPYCTAPSHWHPEEEEDNK
jgi:hypothetical protein